MEIQNKLWESAKKSFRKNPGIFYGVLTVVVLFVASIIFFYTAPREVSHVQKTASFLPYPIVWVDGRIITERELSQNMDSVKRFYTNQDFSSLGLRVDFSNEEGQKRLRVREREVLNKMVEDEAFRVIAKERGITVSEDEVKEDIRQRLDEYGTGGEVEKNLDQLYGWNIKDFAEKVVTPALYQSRLEEVYRKETDQKGAKEKIEGAEKDLVNGGNFPDVARKYSEGSTGQSGGELGWFQLGDLAPELQESVKNAPIGKTTQILESSLGYHLIRVEETKDDNGTMLYRLSQVFVEKISFSSWLTQEMQKLNISVWSPFYRWNAERAQVDFQDEAWQQYEQSVYGNSTQDALFVN